MADPKNQNHPRVDCFKNSTEEEKQYFQPLRKTEILSLNYRLSLSEALKVYISE